MVDSKPDDKLYHHESLIYLHMYWPSCNAKIWSYNNCKDNKTKCLTLLNIQKRSRPVDLHRIVACSNGIIISFAVLYIVGVLYKTIIKLVSHWFNLKEVNILRTRFQTRWIPFLPIKTPFLKSVLSMLQTKYMGSYKKGGKICEKLNLLNLKWSICPTKYYRFVHHMRCANTALACSLSNIFIWNTFHEPFTSLRFTCLVIYFQDWKWYYSISLHLEYNGV